MPESPDESAEPRQRWRLVVARAPSAPAATQRQVTEAWIDALERAGLPLVSEGTRARSRVSFGAPLPVGMAAESELIDVVLTDRWPAWRVREALAAAIPPGWQLIDVHDVWLGGPPLAGRVVAADYRVELDADADADTLDRVAREVVAAERIPRRRVKGGATVAYDLRPLIGAVTVEAGPPPIIRTRTRFDPALGTGRPEEVIGALGDRLGSPIAVRSIVRERVLLDEDLAVEPPLGQR